MIVENKDKHAEYAFLLIRRNQISISASEEFSSNESHIYGLHPKLFRFSES